MGFFVTLAVAGGESPLVFKHEGHENSSFPQPVQVAQDEALDNFSCLFGTIRV